MRKRIAICLLAFFLLMFSFIPSAFAGTKGLQQVANGIVRIVCGSNVATGFAVGARGNGAQLFVTNAHAIASDPDNIGIALDYIGQGATIVPAKLVHTWENVNVALLVTEEPIQSRTPLVLSSYLKATPGQKVYTMGFDVKRGEHSPSTPEDLTYFEGVIQNAGESEKGLVLQTDAVMDGGNTGGPLLLEDGSVIGVNISGPLNNDGTAQSEVHYAAAIDYIAAFLDSENVPYESDGTKPQQREEQPAQGGTQDEQGQPPQGQPVEPATPSNGSDLSRYALIAAGAAAVGLLIRYFSKRKRPSQQRNDETYHSRAVYDQTPGFNTTPDLTAPVPSSRSREGYPQIEGSSGYFLNNRFSIRDSIVLGRDPKRCNVIYPKQTPGVSALHCEVRNVGGKVELIDRGSHYGTYLSSGTKCLPNTPHLLSPGDSFYLATRENRFKVL